MVGWPVRGRLRGEGEAANRDGAGQRGDRARQHASDVVQGALAPLRRRALCADEKVAVFVADQPWRTLCCRKAKQQQEFVHVLLQRMPVHIVRVAAEGVRQVAGDPVKDVQHEDLDESEQRRPHRVCRPLRSYERRHEPMHDQQAVASLAVGRGERRRREPHRAVVLNDPVGDLLEQAGEQRRRRRQGPIVHIRHDQVLQPSTNHFHLALTFADQQQAVHIDALRGNEVVVVGEVVGGGRPGGFEVRQRRRVQQTDEPDQKVLEAPDLERVRAAIRDEAVQTVHGVDPLGPHLVRGSAPLPPAGVRLRAPEDHEEAQEKGKSAPHDRLLENAAVLAEKRQGAVGEHPLQDPRENGVRHREEEAELEGAAEVLRTEADTLQPL
mmetsp:Transcript_122787/g.352647  ORF Transcript_122787/g.352647 Transcript_122787/m.352647 type:complete len:382 (+) Transcript_122787:697-1842(+)